MDNNSINETTKSINKHILQHTNNVEIVKEELTNLYNYLNAIRLYWDEPRYVTLSVLVQNMAHEGEVIEKAYNCIMAMHKMCPEDHVVAHAIKELNHIVFASNAIREYEATMMDDEFLYRGY